MLKDQAGDLAVNCQAGPNPVINLTGLIVPPALVRPRRCDDRNNFCCDARDPFFQRCGRV
jgi:hypothetical protein